MKLVFEFGYYVFLGSFEDRHIPKRAGFFFDPKRRAWKTKFADRALKLRQYADKDANQRLLDRIVPTKELDFSKPYNPKGKYRRSRVA